MRNTNTATRFDLEEDFEKDESWAAPLAPAGSFTTRSYKVIGQGFGAVPVPQPQGQPQGRFNQMPQPLPNLPLRRLPSAANRSAGGPRPTGAGQLVPAFRPPASRPVQSTWNLKGRLEWLAGQSRLSLALLAGGALCICIVIYLVFSIGLRAWQTWQDDLTYGRPRTMQLDQFVGHNEQEGVPSHFIAQNNNHQVTVIEYPGGDAGKTRVFQGPHLFGKEAELVPVKIHFEDVNGDSHVDMILEVDNQVWIYVNGDSTFRPMSSEEKAKIKLKEGAGR